MHTMFQALQLHNDHAEPKGTTKMHLPTNIHKFKFLHDNPCQSTQMYMYMYEAARGCHGVAMALSRP